MNNKEINEFDFRTIYKKNYGDLGGCFLPRPKVSVDNTLRDLYKSSYPSQPLSLIAN